MIARQGFIDLQVNGILGIDFSSADLTLEDIRNATSELLMRGTVAYCPTIVTGPDEMYRKVLPMFAKAMQDGELGRHILGIHLEGPFISPGPGARGVHPEEFIRQPSLQLLSRYQEYAGGNISIVTVAPELSGSAELIEYASGAGITVMLGHHMADDASIRKAVHSGARGCTHLGNGMPNVIHRHANPLWFQLACDDLTGAFITDGHHLPPSFIKAALRVKGVDRFIVSSDAGLLTGLPVGTYEYLGKTVDIEPSGRVSCRETGSLAGSHSTMLECMNCLASLDLLSEEELWRVGFDNPLRLLGRPLEKFGDYGRRAVDFNGKLFSAEVCTDGIQH